MDPPPLPLSSKVTLKSLLLGVTILSELEMVVTIRVIAVRLRSHSSSSSSSSSFSSSLLLSPS